MFEFASHEAAPGTLAAASPVGAAEVVVWRDSLAHCSGGAQNDAELIDLLRALEELTAAASAAQARVTMAFDSAVRGRLGPEATEREHVEVSRSVAGQVGLARRHSRHRGGRDVGLAKVLCEEMPESLAALTRGETNEWRATLMARETACLSAEDRRRVDHALGPRLREMGDREVEQEARRLGYRLDPGAAARQTSHAHAERRVSLRPAPDTMTHLTGFLPVRDGVACWAALVQAADRATATGDDRSRGQVMADTLVARVTGRKSAEGVALEVDVVISAESLHGAGDDPAFLPGYGAIPASLAREMIRDTTAQVWLRRLFARPATGELVSMDSRRRCFEGNLRRFTIVRDRLCRTPWCDAPIRHLDHPERHADGGETSDINGQGLCAACNYTKEAPGWRSRSALSRRHTVVTTTPTGHTYASRAPAPPGRRPDWTQSVIELRFQEIVDAY